MYIYGRIGNNISTPPSPSADEKIIKKLQKDVEILKVQIDALDVLMDEMRADVDTNTENSKKAVYFKVLEDRRECLNEKLSELEAQINNASDNID